MLPVRVLSNAVWSAEHTDKEHLTANINGIRSPHIQNVDLHAVYHIFYSIFYRSLSFILMNAFIRHFS